MSENLTDKTRRINEDTLFMVLEIDRRIVHPNLSSIELANLNNEFKHDAEIHGLDCVVNSLVLEVYNHVKKVPEIMVNEK